MSSVGSPARATTPTLESAPALAAFPRRAELGELARVAAEALRFFPPLYLQSLLGPAFTWLDRRRLSEFTIIDWRRALRTLDFLSRISVPSVHREPPALFLRLFPRFLNDLFWRPTTAFEQPEPPDHSAHPGERWFFINGVATNRAVAELNAALLGELFGRQIRVIQNATNSLVPDLWQSALGKEFKTSPDRRRHESFTEPCLEATIEILEALTDHDVDKVVVIAHSQGTIIAANVLRAIAKTYAEIGRARLVRHLPMRAKRAAVELTRGAPRELRPLRRRFAAALVAFMRRRDARREQARKLEIYTFANCADTMKYLSQPGESVFPWLEHFANERDLVARLGILSPYQRTRKLIDIDGPVYLRRATALPTRRGWGHLLNQHHLFAISDHLEGRSRADPYPAAAGPGKARLYGYFGGNRPDETAT